MKTTVKLRDMGVIDRSPPASTIYGLCDVLMVFMSIIPMFLILLSVVVFKPGVLILDIVGYIVRWIFCCVSLLAGLVAIRKLLLEIKDRKRAISIYYSAIGDGMAQEQAVKLANIVDENYAYLELMEDHKERMEFLKKVKVL